MSIMYKGTDPLGVINNTDKAKKSDLTSIFETGTTASQAISAGTYFYLDGVLVRAKTAIASGATFTEDTNYEVVNAGALNRLAEIENKTFALARRGITSPKTTWTLLNWSTFFVGLIVGFMDNVGGFVGVISGTTYVHISGADMNQNGRLTLSLSGTTLTLTGVSTFVFTFVSGTIQE